MKEVTTDDIIDAVCIACAAMEEFCHKLEQSKPNTFRRDDLAAIRRIYYCAATERSSQT